MVLLVHQQFDRSGVSLRPMPAQGQAIAVAGTQDMLRVSLGGVRLQDGPHSASLRLLWCPDGREILRRSCRTFDQVGDPLHVRELAQCLPMPGECAIEESAAKR